MKNIKNLEKATIKAEYSRHYPDPLNKSSDGDQLNIEHHILVSRAIDVPAGISKAPNPRVQRTDKGIYKEVRKSLDNTDDLYFHLKNKGITILAHHVEYGTDKKTVDLYLGEGDGIVDGAHTYQIILDAQEAGTCPEGQYVKLEVLTGIPQEMGPEITGGLNTAVQVDDASLMNLEGAFDWVKETLKKTAFGDRIAYKQNEDFDGYDIRDILSFMTLFNVNKFPYTDGRHPKDAYVSKARCLELYQEDPASFKMLKPILIDILHLHDYVHIQSRERYNEEMGGRAAAMKGVYATKKRGTYEYIFTGEERNYRLYDGALYPMLGAMRFLAEQKPGEKVYSWKLKSFDKVKSFFDEVAPDLVATTYKTSLIYGRKPNPIGKDDNHWDNMYKTVALHFYSKYSPK
jgi:hypothetical protein